MHLHFWSHMFIYYNELLLSNYSFIIININNYCVINKAHQLIGKVPKNEVFKLLLKKGYQFSP